MVENIANKTRIIPDLLNMTYEFLFRAVGRDGKLSFELKCLFLVLIVIMPGLITISLTGSFPYTLLVYLRVGWGHFVTTLFMGVFIWFLIRFLRRIDEKIHNVSQIIAPPERKKGQEGYEEWRCWDRRIREYTKWVQRLTSHKWYYFEAIGGAVCGFLLGILLIKPGHGWVTVGTQLDPLRGLYLRVWCIFYGFFLGACLNYIGGGFWAIRKYCQDVVSHEEILPLNPDHTGGLRELGRLSLDLDLIVALPSVAFPLYLLRPKLWEFLETLGYEVTSIDTGNEIPIAVLLSVLYAVFLVIVFFVSISPAHDDMVKGKTNYLLKIHRELLGKLDTKKRITPKEYGKLSGLYELYDRVERMAVWPLDFRTTLRFSITSLLPLISIGITISI